MITMSIWLADNLCLIGRTRISSLKKAMALAQKAGTFNPYQKY
uniref:Uncharacterized protein n=1 Tax=Acinetobacter phage vB_AbaM-SPB TaxID=3236747 RepID=A0AB39C8S6_9CAUD